MQKNPISLPQWTSIATVFLLLGAISCQPDTGQSIWKAYYYPTAELEDGLVYTYKVSSADSIYEDVWFYKSIFEDTVTYFTAQQYDEGFNVTKFQMYRLSNVGSHLVTDISYTTDSAGLAIPNESEVLLSQAFVFSPERGRDDFQTSLRYRDLEGRVNVDKVISRQYLRDTFYFYNKKEFPAILVDVKETCSYDKTGRSDVINHSIEMYAMNLGLVHIIKNNSEEMKLVHRLDTIYEMKDFLKVRFSE